MSDLTSISSLISCEEVGGPLPK